MTNRIILAGNPNVGKSTLFNRLTGMRQHTGNWSGKTVGSAVGTARIGSRELSIIDTPGTYSLFGDSEDEILAAECICRESCDAIVLVCDACRLERGLYLALQIMERRSGLILCLNMMDEAKKQGLEPDLPLLSRKLGIPAIGLSAARDTSLDELSSLLLAERRSDIISVPSLSTPTELKKKASELRSAVMKVPEHSVSPFDRLLSHRIFAWPFMALLLFIILWLSISGANYPSMLLNAVFTSLGSYLSRLFVILSIPEWVRSMLMDGVYGTTAWVVSVMLPPMAIFFPLFTLLEDGGLLPRIAFNMDCIFQKCGCCGKQALTMCMGIGCNAVGVTGCRIIPGRRERLATIITNSFMPCNGRFPTIIVLSSLLFPHGGSAVTALTVLAVILLGAVLTLVSCKLLALFYPEKDSKLFTLELPPFRMPKIRETLLLSLRDRTAKILLRAIMAAAPAGLVIWLLANMGIMEQLSSAFDGFGHFFGLSGEILLGFMLGLPANEIVLPAIMLCYFPGPALSELPGGPELEQMLTAAGWTEATMLCVLVFTLLHWPCATTLITIKKESGSLGWTLLAAVLPTVWGLLLCLLVKVLLM